MRKAVLTAVFIFLMVASSFAGLQPTAQVDNTAGTQAMPPYQGPKARIAVADFDVKAAKADYEIGSGLREMLVTALINSSRFRVMERQVLNAIMQEQELSASGAAQPGGVQRGQIKTADLIVTAAVTEFEPEASGGAAGLGGGGKLGKTLLGAVIGGAMNKAHMALDIRIIDSSTSEVLAATRVQGQATDMSGGLFAGMVNSVVLGGGLSAYANTPMEKAIRVCIIEAVKYIASGVPPEYFKY
ncbi:MAG TPA: CsgG/HfaB family protein [Candidatus Omnitrophota bacterium]|nr:CsgG/HfaB family protein [Candidatus Omnitrophota bacterium]HRZ14322.1 CsgG/HfaB family protein [Candidatus Omnitrophota bacterium]